MMIDSTISISKVHCRVKGTTMRCGFYWVLVIGIAIPVGFIKARMVLLFHLYYCITCFLATVPGLGCIKMKIGKCWIARR